MAIRRIHCPNCKPPPLDAFDIEDDWKSRLMAIDAKKPAEHFLVVTEIEKGQSPRQKRTDLPNLQCDKCGAVIPDGSKAWAFTMWQGQEPVVWEVEYGTITDAPPL